MAPPQLAPRLQSLPPILDNLPRTPTSSCSKGSRGLSVQPRVLGIFTETTISPDPSKRQRPSRYAIRAGRNFASILRFRRRRLSLHLGEPIAKGRRLIASIDCAVPSRAPHGLRCHVHVCGLVFVNDQSLRGQRGTSEACATRLPTGLPFRCHDVLEASHTRRASPLLAGLSARITPDSGNSITRQGISLP